MVIASQLENVVGFGYTHIHQQVSKEWVSDWGVTADRLCTKLLKELSSAVKQGKAICLLLLCQASS